MLTLLPTPQVLQKLSAGQLPSRLQRTVRLWVLLQQFYGEPNWVDVLPSAFSYPDVRDRLFAASHPRPDHLSTQDITANCTDSACLCHQTLQNLLFHPLTQQTEAQWLPEMVDLMGVEPSALDAQLQRCPFATVHRSIRDDLKLLVQLGWLRSAGQGVYHCQPEQAFPFSTPTTLSIGSSFNLSPSQTWELLRVLESVSFIQPNLELVVQSLWEQATLTLLKTHRFAEEPSQRIFIHLDYILSPNLQERVDTYQDQVEQLWQTPNGGVVQFVYWLAREERQVTVTVYPVCLHYARRAKYLSAYGLDPTGQITWHNYRLDRISSDRLKVLAWGDPAVPKSLKALWRTGQLPTPEAVRTALDTAWGFNFYLPRELLLLRFPKSFACWYVDGTVRHPTFQAIAYHQLPALICQAVSNHQEQQALLSLIKQRSPQDAYYQAWIRTGDTNVLLRLRDWRPNGEVLAPLAMRQQMAAEANQERAHYYD